VTMPLSIRVRSVLVAAGALVVLMGPGCGSKPPKPSAMIVSLAISPGSVQAGGNATGTVSLSNSDGGTVSLSTATSGVTVPGSVTVNAGSQTATFTVTVGSSVASGNVTVTGTINGSSASGTFSVSGGGGGVPTLVSVSVSSGSVQGGNGVTGTVTLSGNAPNGGLAVTLSSNNGAAGVPGSLTVSAGQSSATFTVSTTVVGSATGVMISASLNGVTQTATLNVTPVGATAPVASFTVRANVGGTANECKFLGPPATLDCTFDASASTNAASYFWRYSVGGNRIDPAAQSSPVFRNPSTTIAGNNCGLFNGQTGGGPTSLNMIVTLTVRSAAGVDSAPSQNNNVKVLPSGTACGF